MDFGVNELPMDRMKEIWILTDDNVPDSIVEKSCFRKGMAGVQKHLSKPSKGLSVYWSGPEKIYCVWSESSTLVYHPCQWFFGCVHAANVVVI